MKTYINGICYDTDAAQPIASVCFSLRGTEVEETAYQMPNGRCFIIRRSRGRETGVFPVNAEDICWWKQHRRALSNNGE